MSHINVTDEKVVGEQAIAFLETSPGNYCLIRGIYVELQPEDCPTITARGLLVADYNNNRFVFYEATDDECRHLDRHYDYWNFNSQEELFNWLENHQIPHDDPEFDPDGMIPYAMLDFGWIK